MKITFKNISIFLALTLALISVVNAGEAALIVKQDGAKVYIDTSDLQIKPKEGDAFRIADLGEEIINPKTGKKLGREVKSQINGHITQTEDLYAVGQLEEVKDVNGKEAEVFASLSPWEREPQFTAAPVAQALSNGMIKLSPVLQTKNIEGRAKAAAAADITGDGKTQLAFVFEDNSIKIYNLEGKELKEITEYSLTPLRKIISVDAADIKNAGRAQLFASVYDSGAEKFYTLVFEYQNGGLEQTDTIRGAVKGISVQNGPRALYVQDINEVTGLGKISKLEYSPKDGFGAGEQVKSFGLESIFGFNSFDFKGNGEENIIYTTPYRKLRVQFEKRGSYIETPSSFDFGSTPNRIKINGRAQRLYTPILAFKNKQDGTVVAAVEHKAKLGLLSDIFGSYSSANIDFLNWTENGFVPAAQAEIPGVIFDILQADFGAYKNAVIAPFANGAGQTGVMIFDASAA